MTIEQIDVEQATHWTVERESWNHLVQHALRIYPKEACGILLNHSEKPRHIREVYPTKNISSEDQARRFLVDPNEFIKADTWAEEQGLDICGFYHSHPDHPSAPSEYDRKMAWEGYLYLILSVKGGKFQDARAWIYDSDDERFNEVMFEPHPVQPLQQDSSHP
ncbi:MAG: M67 family metallopeptidase [Desulfobacteraceae bacterium]